MKTSTSLFSSRRLCIAVIVLAALVGSLLSLELTYHVGNGAFRNDYFRHFFFTVIPIVDGSGSLSLLFNNHHASPLLHFHQIFTSLVLDGSLRIDAYTGIVFFFIMAVYLAVTAFQELSIRSGSQFYAVLVAMLIALIMTGLTATGPIAWPLIFLQGYVLFFGLLVSVATYRLCIQPDSSNRMALYAGSVVLAIFLHTSYGMLFFVASIPAIAIRIVSQRNYKLLALLMGAVSFSVFWNYILLPMFGQLEARDSGRFLDYITARLLDLPLLMAAFGKAFATGVHGDTLSYTLHKNPPGSWQLMGFILIAIAYAYATLWALFAQRKVLIAGVILLAVLLGISAALLSRGGEFFAFNLDAPRYVLLYRLAAGAFLWSIADALVGLFYFFAPKLGKDNQNILLSVATLVLLFTIIAMQVAAFNVASKRKSEMALAAGWTELSVYMLGVDSANTYSLRNWQSGGNASWVYNRVIAWLAVKKANVFSPDYRGSDYLTNYKRARSVYQSGRDNPLPLKIDRHHCIKHSGFSDTQAWNVTVESSNNGSFSLVFDTPEPPPLTYFIRAGVQNLYGTLPPGTPFHLCFPPEVVVSSFTHLPALDSPEE